MALSEYSSAHEKLQDLISGNSRWSPYYRAFHHIEAAAALLYQEHDFSHKILDQQLFERNDGSPLQRLNLIYGASSHSHEQLRMRA